MGLLDVGCDVGVTNFVGELEGWDVGVEGCTVG